MRRFILLSLILLLFSFSTIASKKVDSLAALIRSEKSEPRKLELLKSFCELNRSYAVDTFYVYASKTQQLAGKLNDKERLAYADYYLALYYYTVSKLDSTIIMINVLKQQYIPNQEKRVLLRNNVDILQASLLMKQNKLKDALKLYYTVLENAIKTKDSTAYIKALNGIGWGNMELARYDEAINWFNKVINIPISESYRKMKPIPYINIAACYGSIDKIDSAQYYVEEGLKIARQYDDLFALSNGLNILGNVYIAENNLPNAIQSIKEATATRQLIGDPFFIVSDMSQLAFLYANNKQYDTAIALSKRSIEIAQAKKMDAKMSYLYNILAQIYSMKGDYKNAYLSVSEVLKCREESYQNASVKELEELKVKYQTSLKEATIQKQQFQLSRKNYMLYGSLMLICLMSLVALMAYRNFKHRSALKLQKALAEQREESAKAIWDVEEKERARIARDLHDGIGPMLSAVKYNLSGITDKMNQLNEEEKQFFEKAINILDESSKEVRQVSHSIMPNALLTKGLVNAIQDFVSKIDSEKLQVNLHFSGIQDRLEPKTEIAVYRVIQECINNVMKHANATKLDISLVKDADGLSVTIEDNGKGFDLSEARKNGIGLNNIITRIHFLKGELEIDSRPGNGTLVAFHIS